MPELDDPYIERRAPYFEAAVPDIPPPIEHTFGLFLSTYVDVFEPALRGRILTSSQELIAQASSAESSVLWEEQRIFARKMTFLAEQIPVDNHAAAIDLISEAFIELYESRRRRYMAAMAKLDEAELRVLREVYFDRLQAAVIPLQGKSQEYQFVLGVYSPAEHARRIEIRKTFLLVRGVPNVQVSRHDGGEVTCLTISGAPGLHF